ncbi:hypothetical protein AMTRI_Chr09g39570 [Amborella trichopoda]
MSVKKSSFAVSLGCGCRSSKSVAVKRAQLAGKSKPPTGKTSCPDNCSHFSGDTSVSSNDFRSETTTSFSGLLKELEELERSVAAWPGSFPEEKCGSRASFRRAEAVVRVSEDPVRDFKRSMVEMMVEKGVLGIEGMKAVVDALISLNAPEQHCLILRAFMEIWESGMSEEWSCGDHNCFS